jgi:hypothetical protein
MINRSSTGGGMIVLTDEGIDFSSTMDVATSLKLKRVGIENEVVVDWTGRLEVTIPLLNANLIPKTRIKGLALLNCHNFQQPASPAIVVGDFGAGEG